MKLKQFILGITIALASGWVVAGSVPVSAGSADPGELQIETTGAMQPTGLCFDIGGRRYCFRQPW
ncbi:MAG: hypothetical protein L0Y32_01435 [Nevskiales bacterium]|nr:hypothetical protein [Nevskiales bacterium]